MDETFTPFLRYADIQPSEYDLWDHSINADCSNKELLHVLQGITIPVRDEVVQQLMERLKSDEL